MFIGHDVNNLNRLNRDIRPFPKLFYSSELPVNTLRLRTDYEGILGMTGT